MSKYKKNSLSNVMPLRKPDPSDVSSFAGIDPVKEMISPVAKESKAPEPESKKPKEKPAKRVNRNKLSYYITEEEAGRVRAVFWELGRKFGWRNITEMQHEIIMNAVEAFEKEYNGGKPYDPIPKGGLGMGRPPREEA